MKVRKQKQDLFSADETRQRFEAALRGAFVTPAIPMKDIPRKRPKTKRKPKLRTSV